MSQPEDELLEISSTVPAQNLRNAYGTKGLPKLGLASSIQPVHLVSGITATTTEPYFDMSPTSAAGSQVSPATARTAKSAWDTATTNTTATIITAIPAGAIFRVQLFSAFNINAVRELTWRLRVNTTTTDVLVWQNIMPNGYQVPFLSPLLTFPRSLDLSWTTSGIGTDTAYPSCIIFILSV